VTENPAIPYGISGVLVFLKGGRVMPDRKPLPERRAERIALGLTSKELERFEKECEREGLSRSGLLRKAIRTAFGDGVLDVDEAVRP
jgi:hypothetical protein